MITGTNQHPSITLEDCGREKVQKVSVARLSKALGFYHTTIAALLAIGFSASAATSEPATGPKIFASHQERVSLAALSVFELVILDASCVLDLTNAPSGQRVIARVEMTGSEADVSVWTAQFLTATVEPLMKRGFNGIAVSGLGSDEKSRLSALLETFSSTFPGRTILVQDPPAELDALLIKSSGVVFEGVVTSKHRDALPPETRAARVRDLASRKIPVYAVEYSEVGGREVPSAIASQVTALGAIPFVTTREATGVSLAPLRDHSRRVLVLFGWDPKEEEKPSTWPTDTMTADLLQAPLEWLGYEADYLDVGKADLPQDVGAKHAAIVLDADLSVPLVREAATARWLLAAKAQSVPVLFMGGIPFASDEARRVLAEGLGLKGSLQPVPKVTNPTVTQADKAIMNAEVKAVPRTSDYTDLAAPDKSQVLLSLQGRGPDGALIHYDPVFLTSWGGMWLEPYVVFRGSADSNLFYADPYRILAALLSKRGIIPAPDATTRDGRRMFYSHIDGDGFASDSNFRGRPLCAELVRDRILKVFPFPVTVSVIEADMKTLAEGLDDADRDRIVATARSIFELPHVRAASHSFSHPYQWDKDDPNPGNYDEPNMPLKPAANYPTIDPVREITGSVDFINKNLLPAGKQVELMLWSGNCRPGTRALEVCRLLGVENMNGGNTIVSRLYPGIAGTAPRVMPWGDEIQIHAANQNEFMYANGWQGPFFGGFADVVDTFERTDKGRRTKPVNVYYHFYSATSLSSLRALEKIHQWCERSQLHSVTALQYARIAKDAWRTKVYEVAPRHWLLANQGDLRTFRLPKYLGRPDMARCKGVSGYIEHEDSVYVHTLGQSVTELVLGDEAEGPVTADTARLRLTSCSAEIAFQTFDPLKVAFTVSDLRPVEAEFSGLQPKADCQVRVDSSDTRIAADDHGRIKLSLPPSAKVSIDATRSRYASAR